VRLKYNAMELKPITGTLAATNQPDSIASAAPSQTYFGVAENLMPGVRVLAKKPQCAIALCMLCAHVVESLLKAYASKALGSEAAVSMPFRSGLSVKGYAQQVVRPSELVISVICTMLHTSCASPLKFKASFYLLLNRWSQNSQPYLS